MLGIPDVDCSGNGLEGRVLRIVAGRAQTQQTAVVQQTTFLGNAHDELALLTLDLAIRPGDLDERHQHDDAIGLARDLELLEHGVDFHGPPLLRQGALDRGRRCVDCSWAGATIFPRRS
jgi:hypothetical protein